LKDIFENAELEMQYCQGLVWTECDVMAAVLSRLTVYFASQPSAARLVVILGKNMSADC
jgi:hypothetical protein